jgi:hypothetical protein
VSDSADYTNTSGLLGQFDPMNQMIKLSVITLSGALAVLDRRIWL